MDSTKLTLLGIADGEDTSSVLGNRIRKNYKHLRKWAKRTETDSFRIYDRDISQYPIAIDYYAGRFCVHYFAPSREQSEPSLQLVEETNNAICKIFGISSKAIYWRTRIKSKDTRQYEKVDESHDFFTSLEYGVKFRINLEDYLDTGLFLDHRETRRIVTSSCKGKRVLNLFAYTCSFSVHAAIAGATFTKSVDLSNTYTEWGKDNFYINGISLDNNEVIRADCLKFLDLEIAAGIKYDIIIIDPPTISRSKKMDQLFDIQVDYISLISKGLKLLSPGGIIFFSTNSRKFVFDETLFKGSAITEISHKTVAVDFPNAKMHRCWKISF